MGASTVSDFKIPNCRVRYTPAGAVSYMSASILGDDTAVLVWSNRVTIWAASIPADKLLTDNAVDPADIKVVMTGGTGMRGISSWTVGTTHYVVTHEGTAPAGARFYRSDDLAQTWTHISSIGTRSGDHYNDFYMGLMMPLYVDGRYHFRYGSDSRYISNDNFTMAAWAYTPDFVFFAGVHTRNYGLFENSGSMSAHAVQDPNTGTLFHYVWGNNTGDRHMCYSTDNGDTWGLISYATAPNGFHPCPFVDDGTYIYAFNGNLVYRSADPFDPLSWEQVGQHNAGTTAMRISYQGTDMYLDTGGIWVDGGGWQVGSVGFG